LFAAAHAIFPATGILIDAVFPTVGMLRDGSERPSFDRHVAAVRRRRGASAFAAGWEQGLKLSIDEAIEDASMSSGWATQTEPARL
jgi:hypothetical protein